ncbi:DUF4364 family protein [Clostridium sp. DL1XJH146]
MLNNRTSELAENKLLVLYILKEINLPISNNSLTEIVLKNNFTDYFTLQQFISELCSAKFVDYIELDGKQRLVITNQGEQVLTLFFNRISPLKLNIIKQYLKQNLDLIKKEITITADYTIEGNNYIVNLKATENKSILLDLKVNVASNSQAKELCSKWKANSSELYNKLLKVLIED